MRSWQWIQNTFEIQNVLLFPPLPEIGHSQGEWILKKQRMKFWILGAQAASKPKF